MHRLRVYTSTDEAVDGIDGIQAPAEDGNVALVRILVGVRVLAGH